MHSDEGGNSSGGSDAAQEALLELGLQEQAVPVAVKSLNLENSLEQEGSGHRACRVLQHGNVTSGKRNNLCNG